MSESSPATGIVAASMHPLVLEGLEGVVTKAGMRFCAGVADREALLRIIDEKKPDVGIIDLTMRNTGEAFGKRDASLRTFVGSIAGKVKCIMLGDQADHRQAGKYLQAGARGYFGMGIQQQTLVNAIAKVMDGKLAVEESIEQHLMQKAANGGKLDASPVELLTDRELEVFKLLGKGKPTKEIASCLHLSPKTVETHRDRIKKKLGLDDGPTLMVAAVRYVLENE